MCVFSPLYSSGHGNVPVPFLLNGLTVCVGFPLYLHCASVVHTSLLRLRYVCICSLFAFYVACAFCTTLLRSPVGGTSFSFLIHTHERTVDLR